MQSSLPAGSTIIPSLTRTDNDALFIDFNVGAQDLSSNKCQVACVGKEQARLLKKSNGQQVLSLDGSKKNILYAAYSDTLVSSEGVTAEIAFKVPSSVKGKIFYLLQNGHNWGICYDRGLIRGYVLLDGAWRIVTLPQRIAPDTWQQIRFSYLAANRKSTLSLNGREMARKDFSDLKLSNYKLKAQKQRIAIGWDASGWGTVPMTGEISAIRITLPKPGRTEAKNALKKKVINGNNFDPSPIRHPRLSAIGGKTPKHLALDNFSDLSRWHIEFDPEIVDAKLYRGEVEKMWNDTNLKLAFKIVPKANDLGTIYVRPKQPITIAKAFDTFSMWIYLEALQVKRTGALLSAEFVDGEKKNFSIPLKLFDIPGKYREGWNYLNYRLPGKVNVPAQFIGFKVDNINTGDIYYFDSPCVYLRDRGTSKTARIPAWSEIGAPTRPETILPKLNSGTTFTNSVTQTGDAYIFTYSGSDEKINYVYCPVTGLLSDIECQTANGKFFPAWDGGWVLDKPNDKTGNKIKAASASSDGDSLKMQWDSGNKNFSVNIVGIKRKLKSVNLKGNTLSTVWHWSGRGFDFESCLNLTIKQKSLIIDASCNSNKVVQFSLGAVAGLEKPIMTQVPYLTLWGHYTTRPGKNPRDVNPRILYDRGAFFSSFMDWYNTEASEFFSDVDKLEVNGKKACVINGGSAYLPKSDGTRNMPRERIFLTVSKFFDETLPVVANPPNPSNKITSSMIWATRGWYPLSLPVKTYYDQEYAFWQKMYDYGARDIGVRYHVSSYRAYIPSRTGAEFAFPTTLDERIGGGDEKYKAYVQAMWRNLGFRTGQYVNYTLLSPANPDNFKEEWVSVVNNKQLSFGHELWAYVSKVSQIEAMQKHAGPKRKAAWEPTLSYYDQLTAHPPWRFVDYDATTPEAGKFSAVIRAFAESMIEERKYVNNGPVLSEGIHQWFFAGFCDSYAQTTRGWYGIIPNFQLGSVHLLSNDCGFSLDEVVKDSANADFVLVNEILFGQIGHLMGIYQHETPQTPSLQTVRSYFMIQQLQKYYANVAVEKILYWNDKKLLPIERAIPEGFVDRGMVAVRYVNGLELRLNRNKKENWPVVLNGRKYLLPPLGWVAELPGKILEYSALINGRKVDFVYGGDYSYLNGNGVNTNFGVAKCAGSYTLRYADGILRLTPAPYTGKIEKITIDLAAFAPNLTGKNIEVRPYGESGAPLDYERNGDVISFNTVAMTTRYEIAAGIPWE